MILFHVLIERCKSSYILISYHLFKIYPKIFFGRTQTSIQKICLQASDVVLLITKCVPFLFFDLIWLCIQTLCSQYFSVIFEKKLNPIFHGLNLNRVIFWCTSRLEIIVPAPMLVGRKLSFVKVTALFSFDRRQEN